MKYAGIGAYLLPMAAAAFFIGWSLNERGVYIYDEAHFLLAARTLEDGIRGIVAGQLLSTLKTDILRTGGTLYFAAKPGHIALLALIGLATGGLTAFKGLLLSFAAGIGVVFLTQNIATRRCGELTGLIAGMFTAMTPLLVANSRSTLGVSTSVFFALLAARALMLGTRRDQLSGLLAGIAGFMAFACHYNSIILLAAIVAGIWPTIRARRLWFMTAGFVACVLLGEIITLTAAHFIRPVYPDYMTFLGELIYNFRTYQAVPVATAVTPAAYGAFSDGARGYGWGAWLYLFRSWWNGFGMIIPLALIGTICLLKATSISDDNRRMLLWWVWAPFVFWSLYPWKVERAFASAVPGLAMISAAVTAGCLASRCRSSDDAGEHASPVTAKMRLTAVSLVGWLMIASLYMNIIMIQKSLNDDRSPYALLVSRASDDISALPPNSITAWSAGWRSLPQWKWYLGPEFRQEHGAYPPAVDFRLRQPPRVLCLDMLSSSSLARQHTEDGFRILSHTTLIEAATHRGWAKLAVVDADTSPATTLDDMR